jgi:uncharacterized membrane protein
VARLRAEWYRSGWLQVKFLLVIVLSGLHGMMVRWVRDFAPTATGIRRILSHNQ